MAFKPRQAAGARNTGIAATAALAYTTETIMKKRSLEGNATLTVESSGYSLSDHIEANLRHGQTSQNQNQGHNHGHSHMEGGASFDVEDPYVPSRPNDYLVYCEERVEMRRQEQLEEENIKKFAEIDRMREQMEKERAEAIGSGDVQRMAVAGRGRGRGLSNLPSWMTHAAAAVTATKEVAIGSSSSSSSSAANAGSGALPGQFDDQKKDDGAGTGAGAGIMAGSRSSAGGRKKHVFSNPSCVVLLTNMVGPGEADDQLADETKQECAKYGPVHTCIVHEQKEERTVNIFVHFETQESAVQAYRDLNGRYFAGRQVEATFYDESKYLCRELSSSFSAQ